MINYQKIKVNQYLHFWELPNKYKFYLKNKYYSVSQIKDIYKQINISLNDIEKDIKKVKSIYGKTITIKFQTLKWIKILFPNYSRYQVLVKTQE